MSCYYSGLSVSSVCVASCWRGFDRICPAERFELYSAAIRRPFYTSCALHTFSQYGELAADIVSLVWDTLANFNGFRVLASSTTSLTGGQPNFARSLTVSWAGTPCVEKVLLFNEFFPIVDTRLICEDIPRQSCAMVPRW